MNQFFLLLPAVLCLCLKHICEGFNELGTSMYSSVGGAGGPFGIGSKYLSSKRHTKLVLLKTIELAAVCGESSENNSGTTALLSTDIQSKQCTVALVSL